MPEGLIDNTNDTAHDRFPYPLSMPTLYIIDGYAQFFRAYHAIRSPMTSPVTKEPTNMTFGFVGMMLKLLRGEGSIGGPPDYVAVALDVSGDRGTFRSQLYPEYKATRDAPPEDLAPQVIRALTLLDTIGVPVIGSEGFEADDVVATLAHTLHDTHPDLRIRVISKDKDLKQLLRTGDASGAGAFELYDVHTDELHTAARLKEESGITPEQVVDMLTLMGDTVDNVPGVPGVGPKTAADLIAQFGSLDAVLDEVRADKPKKDWLIKGKRRERILESADALPLSKQLVTLRDDAPVTFDLDKAKRESFTLAPLMPLLKELGFNRYQDELKELLGGGPDQATTTRRALSIEGGGLFDHIEAADTPEIEGDYRCVRTLDELDAIIEQMRTAQLVAIDTETTSTRPMKAELCGISVCVEPGTAYYIPVRSPEQDTHLDTEAVIERVRAVLEDASIPKCGHNIKYDLLVLRRAGITLRGFIPTTDDSNAGDSMIASYVLDASRSSHSMDALSLALLGRQNIPIKELIGTGKNQRTFDTVPLDRATPYAAEDADVTLQLATRMTPELRTAGLGELYRDVELPLIEVLAELEYNGITVDRAELDRQRERLQKQIETLKTRLDYESDAALARTFDPDSPKQLSAALFNKPDADPPGLGITPVRRTKTGYSTDAEVLERLAADPAIETPIPGIILEYRQLTKLVSTYLKALADEIDPTTGRIHASFNQTVAATGRLSSSDPNLQNIPIRSELGREIRKAFVAPEGRVLIAADYSQIELRVLAHLSRDAALIEAFRSGADIHRAVAVQIHGVSQDDVTGEQRSGAKMVNFGIVYGITPFGLARRLGVDQKEAAEIITGYKARFPGITTFLEECVDQARRHGYVETILKRRRPITDIDSNQPNRRSLAERMAINSVVQGSAADLIKLAMIDLHQRIKTSDDDRLVDVAMLLQIHDELVFEAPEANAEATRSLVVERMEAAMDLDVPLVVDASISRDWFGAK